MSARARGSGAPAGAIPLLDTLFLLLFALLAAAAEQDDPGRSPVRIRLPEVAPSADRAGADQTLTLTLDRQSRIFLQGRLEPVTGLEELTPMLEEALDLRAPNLVSVEILGDRGADYGVAVSLLQHLRLMGFARVALLAEQAPTGPELAEDP